MDTDDDSTQFNHMVEKVTFFEGNIKLAVKWKLDASLYSNVFTNFLNNKVRFYILDNSFNAIEIHLPSSLCTYL